MSRPFAPPSVLPKARGRERIALIGLLFVAVTSTLLSNITRAFAHASERGHILLLPTGYYLFGGAAAVMASFAALTLLQQKQLATLAAWRLPLFALSNSARLWTSLASFLVMLGLIAAGIFGSRDPLSNPLPLTVWTLIWIGLTLLQGVFGNLWAWLNPWYGPVRLADMVFPKRWRKDYPPALEYCPALVLFAGFAWFELIHLAPDDPYRLALAVAGYWLVTFMAMLVFGCDAWASQGEFLSVFFRMVSRFAVLDGRSRGGKRDISLCMPAAKLWTEQPLPLSGVMFLLLTLASVSFDGLSKTFIWLGANGINPLEFPGRSAVQGINSAGLAMMFCGLASAFLACVALGRLLAGGGSFRMAAGLLVWSIVPIALAYHFSHYLTALLVNGQYALVALSDPFGLGWNLLGTTHLQVGAGVVMGADSAWVIWNCQALAIIAGHMLAVVIAHALSSRVHGGRARAAELPLTLLMIGYTVFGLWLLSTPAAG